MWLGPVSRWQLGRPLQFAWHSTTPFCHVSRSEWTLIAYRRWIYQAIIDKANLSAVLLPPSPAIFLFHQYMIWGQVSFGPRSKYVLLVIIEDLVLRFTVGKFVGLGCTFRMSH